MRSTTPKGPGSVPEAAITFAGEPLVARSSVPVPPDAPVVVRAGWEVSGMRATAPLRLADLTPIGKVLVHAARSSTFGASMSCIYGRSTRNADGHLVVGSGPEEWTVYTPIGGASPVADALLARAGDEFVTVIDLTHFSTVLRLTGERAPELLARLCAIDLSDEVTPNGAVFRSSVARVAATVVRDDLEGERSYLVQVDRSFGEFLADSLMTAGHGLDIAHDGYLDKEI